MKVFKNSHGEIRCGWPIAAALAAMVVIVPNLEYWVALPFGGSDNFVANMLINHAMLIGLIFLIFWLFYKRHIKRMGFYAKGWLTQMALGLAFGAASITLVITVLLVSGMAKLSPFSAAGLRQGMFWYGLLHFVVAGFWEEIISRGFMMTVLKTTRIKIVIVLFSAAFFSLIHYMNGNATVYSLVNIAMIGVLFSFMLIKTGRLWAPIGFHITWNFFQGYIGIPVSGSPVPNSALFKVAFNGSDWLTGGAFGAEGGVACTLVVLLGMLFVHFAVKSPRNPQEFWSMDGDFPLTRTQVQAENAG
jgi:uncharacterized protein